MNKVKLMFLILRKNTKLLREYIYASGYKDKRVFTDRRKNVINVKRELAAMKPSRYNLIKTIATEIHRFEIVEPAKNFSTQHDMFQFVIPGTEKVIGCSSLYNHFNDTRIDIPRVIHDKFLNIYFILYEESTMVDDVKLFTDIENEWFKQVFLVLEEAKVAEQELIDQQKAIAELKKIEIMKEGILSKYT